jgi:protein tyrosine phosphatase (PTP) superfamily phosphohydrolase (DUF442 family)
MSPRNQRRFLAWGLAGLGVLLQIGWLLAAAGQKVALSLAGVLDRLNAGPGVVERALDALALLPLFLLGALFAALANRVAAAGHRFRVLLPVVFTALLTVVFVHNREYLLYRFAPVEEGVFYRSGQTGEATLGRILDRYGIQTLLFLRRPGERLNREREIAAQRGVRFVHISMRHRALAAERFLAVMDDPANHPVLIHCRYGIARTGVLSAVYRMEYEGWDNDRALAEARLFSGFGGLGEGSENRAFVRSYLPRSRR